MTDGPALEVLKNIKVGLTLATSAAPAETVNLLIQCVAEQARAGNLTDAQVAALKELVTRYEKPAAAAGEAGPAANLARFKKVYANKHCKLEIRPGTLGKIECRFTLHDGQVKAACDKLNEDLAKLPHCPDGWKVHLVYCCEGNQKGRIQVTFTAVLKNSADRIWAGDHPALSNQAFFKKMNLKRVDDNVLRLATGAFRTKMGFPEDAKLIGAPEDMGDLLEGNHVRGRKGSTMSYAFGIDGTDLCGSDYDNYQFWAGASDANDNS